MKRFTETIKWADPWFRNLPIDAKCLWLWLLDNCDCAGIIEPDLDLASFQIGTTKPLASPFEILGDRVEIYGSKVFIPKFIRYQYGQELNMANTAHRGVIRRLELANIPCPVLIIDNTNKAPSKPLQSPLQGAQDKDKDKSTKNSIKNTDKSHILELAETIWKNVNPKSRERSSKAKLDKALLAIKQDQLPTIEILKKALAAWNASQKWKDGYAEGCHIWVNDRQWDNLPESAASQTKSKARGLYD